MPGPDRTESRTARHHPYGEKDEKYKKDEKDEKDEKNENDEYILFGNTNGLCDKNVCNDEISDDYNIYVFNLLNSLVQQHDREYEEEVYSKFHTAAETTVNPTVNPTVYPLKKMTSNLVKNRSTPKIKIYNMTSANNKYKDFSDILFTVTNVETKLDLDALSTKVEKVRTVATSDKVIVINTISRTLFTHTTTDSEKIELIIEREDKNIRGESFPFQRAIYFKFKINDKEYFHCTFIISSDATNTYCTSVHYTTRNNAGKPFYMYIDLDAIIDVFEKNCGKNIINFLVFLLNNFKDNIHTPEKSRKFKCFLGIITGCNPEIEVEKLQELINNFSDVFMREKMLGGKLKNRKKTTTAKPKTTTAKPKTTTAKPKTTTAKPKTTTAKPKTTTAKPKTTTAKPKTTTAKPKTTTAKPKTTTAKPKTTTAKPKTTTAKPKTTTAKSRNAK